MSAAKWLCLLFTALLLGAAPARALSPDQVIALRQAGVSNETIQKMIETEMAVSKSGRQGRYVIKGDQGRSWIVYEASSFSGPSEEIATGINGSDSRVIAASKILAGKKRSKKGGGYTLLVASHRKKSSALALAAKLKAKGVGARVAFADLGKKGRWHRVVVGRFASAKAARSTGESLKAEGKLPSYSLLRQ